MDISFSKIAKEIIQMAREDQNMRFATQKDNSKWDPEIDKRNTNRLKEIVADIGWPTISKVSKEASFKAWLLIQHADEDLIFQKHCLKLMKSEEKSGVDPENVMFLEDRIRVSEGKPQLHGTQFRKNQQTGKLEKV
ncbi:hypothetical protein KKE14_01180 [Patescibacteria group bacterium]|nr:hypothetical protein [Patescibacteria group bacterium]